MFYVGTGYDKDNEPIKDVLKRIERCAAYISSRFGGCSVIDGVRGHWLFKNKLISEDTKIFEVITDADDKKVREAAELLRDALNQTSVLVRKQEIQSEFI